MITCVFVSITMLKHQGVVNFNWPIYETGKKSMYAMESWWEQNLNLV